MRKILDKIMLTLFVCLFANSAHAVTRSCESSNHHIIGNVRLADGSIRENVVVPFHAVEPIMADGYHRSRPAMARRAACKNASSEAAEKMQKRRNYELAMAMCEAPIPGITSVVSVLPKVVGAEAWHGNENNGDTRDFAGAWYNCEEREDLVVTKVYSYPIQYGSYNTLLDWCYRWGNQCGQPAAKAFCAKEGYAYVVEFSGSRNITAGEKTRIISTKDVCDRPSCGTFTQITCRTW